MSSETSTESQALHPWQLFALFGLVGATVVVFRSGGQPAIAIILLSLTIFSAAIVGLAALRTFMALSGSDAAYELPPVVGGRTRAALEREKTLVLRSIKELEFDRAMGKVSEKDFAEMAARLRVRAAGLLRQLDAGSADYQDLIEREIARRLGGLAPADVRPDPAPPVIPAPVPDAAGTACRSCGTHNDDDARFCKNCGGRIEAGS